MNMSSRTIYELKKLYADRFTSQLSTEKETKHLAQMLMYRFLSEIEKLMEERNLSKKELAEAIGVSPSYVTQLYRGTKPLNIETLAKIELALDFRFEIKAVEKSLLEIDESVQQNWNEDQINNFMKKFHCKDGFWLFKKHSPSGTLEKTNEFKYLKQPQNFGDHRNVA